MKKITWIFLFGGLSLTGCSKNETVVPASTPNQDVSALYQQFNGRYKVIRSVSNEAIDVNLDGTKSTNMMTEIPELMKVGQYFTQVAIYGPSAYSKAPSFIFSQWWPEQSIRLGKTFWDGGQPLAYDPTYVVNYDQQGSYRACTFSTDLKQISVLPNTTENPYRWQRPESVTVIGDDTIEVVNKRTLYTREGTKEVQITTRYERYTLAT